MSLSPTRPVISSQGTCSTDHAGEALDISIGSFTSAPNCGADGTWQATFDLQTATGNTLDVVANFGSGEDLVSASHHRGL